MDDALGCPLTEEQRERIRQKIEEIGRDVDYLLKTGGAGPVLGGALVRGAEFQVRRAELLQQVLDESDAGQVQVRIARAISQRAALLVSGRIDEAEEKGLEAGLLAWALGLPATGGTTMNGGGHVEGER